MLSEILLCRLLMLLLLLLLLLFNKFNAATAALSNCNLLNACHCATLTMRATDVLMITFTVLLL
jgi:hypothetical protein